MEQTTSFSTEDVTDTKIESIEQPAESSGHQDIDVPPQISAGREQTEDKQVSHSEPEGIDHPDETDAHGFVAPQNSVSADASDPSTASWANLKARYEERMEHVEDKNTNVLPQVVRLNRFIAMAGISSRRKAEELILNGEVTVNKNVVTDLSTKVSPSTDRVAINGRTISVEEKLVYIVLNKPKDYITTARDEKNRKTVYDLVHTRERIFPGWAPRP